METAEQIYRGMLQGVVLFEIERETKTYILYRVFHRLPKGEIIRVNKC